MTYILMLNVLKCSEKANLCLDLYCYWVIVFGEQL